VPIVDPTSVEVLPYDFRRPPWLSKEKRAVLRGVHDRIAAELERIVAAAVRPDVAVVVSDASQVAFSDWKRELTTPVAAFVTPLSAGEGGESALIIEPALAYRIVDRMLGGTGAVAGRTAALTELEQVILGDLASRIVHAIRDGYRDLAEFSPGESRFESIAESLDIVARHERLVTFDVKVTIGEDSGTMSFTLPAARLARFAQDRLEEPDALPTPPGMARGAIEKVLLTARVDVGARLTSLRLTARDGARLAPGQIFAAPHVFAGTVEIDFNGKPAFHGAIGTNEERVALRLLGPAGISTSPPRLLRRMDDK
jgi:flagellar motor switch protein FliM